MILQNKDIMNLKRTYRINLINSITGAKPANLVGTRSADNVDNVAIFSSVVHIGSHPPYLGFFIRPQTFKSTDTYQNISLNKYFTINSVEENTFLESHLTSKKFERNESEFKYCSIDKTSINNFQAPFVKNSKIKIGLKLVQKKKILNDCTLIIGQVELLKVDNCYLDEDGRVHIDKMNIVSITGADTYNKLNKIETLPYVNSTFNIEDKLSEKKSTI